MALHLAENGCYGIKINPKEPGQELIETELRSALAKFGEVKELQMPNKFLAFAFYVQYEEARNCLDCLQSNGDYLAKPGWPKQTTADEKSARNNGKSATRDESKVSNFRSKEKEEETQQQDQGSFHLKQSQRNECNENNVSPEETNNKTNTRVKFDFKKRNQDSPNNGNKDGYTKTDPSSADQDSHKTTEKNGKIDKHKNFKAEHNDSPKLNGESKETGNKPAITKEEDRFERQERMPRRPYRSEHPRRFRSRSECRNENRNARTNNEDTPKIKYTRGRSVDRSHCNKNKKDADFKKTNFHFKKEYKEDKFSHQKSDYKTKRNSYQNRDGHVMSTEDKNTNKNTLTDKRKDKDAVKQCVLVSALDAWTADMIKFHKRTIRASYVVIFNLPVNVHAGLIYDLTKTWVEVIYVEIKYGTSIYRPPHAFVFTGNVQQSELLKSVLNKKTLKEKTLFVKTQKDLEE